jgi:hypothetical protein
MLIVLSSQFNLDGPNGHSQEIPDLLFIRRNQLAQRVLVQKSIVKAAAATFYVYTRTAAKWARR